MPSLKFNDKEYEIKRKLSFGEVRKFQRVLGTVIGMDKKLKEASPEELETIANDNIKNTEDQMELIESTLKNCLGFDEKMLESLSFSDAITLFNQVFNDSTQIKKKLDQPYV